MITFEKVNLKNMPTEIKLLAYLDANAPESGQMHVPASQLALELDTSESTVRKCLNKLKDVGVLKISDKIYLNPDVFDLSIFARRTYEKTTNKIYKVD